jgi:anthranilate phosphoribosyltransferase
MDDKTLAGYIREIGRGAKAAGDLSRNDARSLYAAMLGGLVPDLQLGAILLAMRVKGESLDELAGFVAAAEASYNHLPLPPGGIPVVIPSYNGARQLPNLVPLLALLLAREGTPVLIHGITSDPGRVTTREVLAALGIEPSFSSGEVQKALGTRGIAFMPIQALAPEIAVMLALRSKLGLRNSTHTVVKMLQPFAGTALRIVSVTHPDYLTRMREYFTTMDTAALLLRGAEGEAVAHPRRSPSIEWASEGRAESWNEESSAAPDLPQDREPGVTARWIEAVLAGHTPVPRAIEHQVECCRRAIDAMEKPAEERP